MSRRDKPDFEDDGRTIADMSGVSRPSLFLPRFQKPPKTAASSAPEPVSSRPWEETSLSREERLWCALGAIKAALLIAFAFIGGLGLIILLFVLFS